MQNKQNLHVHTTFCDGRDTPEEIISEAISRGFDSIGFSIHSYLTCSTIGITPEKIEAYKREILRLKEKYRGKFDVFLGMEYDIYSDCSPLGYDYTLCAVHYLKTPEGRRTFDVGTEGTLDYVQKYFNGDGMAFARSYYEALSSAADYGSFDVIAHIDLVTKNNEKYRFIDTDSGEYLEYAFGAIDALKGKIPYFEVNTGAVARGYRTSPYPQRELLQRLKSNGFGALITSDCHDKRFLDYYFDEAREYLAHLGFKSRFILTDTGFREVAL